MLDYTLLQIRQHIAQIVFVCLYDFMYMQTHEEPT